MNTSPPPPRHDVADDFTTAEVARRLGMAVRSVQLMVDRGELTAWKTPGGHRRISRSSVESWLEGRLRAPQAAPAASRSVPLGADTGALAETASVPRRALLIEDSRHYQNLVRLLFAQHFPGVDLQVADDGYAGLAMAGRLEPDVLLVDILLPGIDGAMLINSLRNHPFFRKCTLVVVTSLDEDERAPYAQALAGIPVVHKARLVTELPALLMGALGPQNPPVAG